MRESRIEAKIRKYLKFLGCLCLKQDARLIPGIPDRLVVMPGGLSFFLEIKTPTGVLSRIQKVRISTLEHRNIPVYVVRSLTEVEEIIESNYPQLLRVLSHEDI